MDANTLKQIRIKTGALKRNVKDIEFSEKELAKEEQRLKEYEGANDEDKIFQQKKVIDETNKMLPLTFQRVKASYEEVSQLAAELPPAATEEEKAQQAEAAATAAAAGGDDVDQEAIKKKQDEAAEQAKKEQEARDSIQDSLASAKAALKQRNIEVEDVTANTEKAVGADDDY